jgi:hypothetical protein
MAKRKRKRYKIIYKSPKVLKVLDYQTGKRISLRRDRKRKALPPSKRRSKSGRIYWETRRNRSDLGSRI